MELVLRGLTIYILLWILFRVSGKRTLRDLTAFDFVLLLIVSECTQQGLIGKDYSITGAATVVATLLGVDILLSLLKQRFKLLEKLVDGVPVILVQKGRPLQDRMKKERVDEADILAAARETHGIGRLDDIDYAILEVSGDVSIIPRRRASVDRER